jgi:hypothetical protein
MSNTSETEEADKNNICANCGVAEVDDIQLMDCDGCYRVKYCGDKCKEEHREHHEEECEKWAAELHDRKLFRQPDGGFLGECPLCFFPMPLDPTKFSFYPCCSKNICNGCYYAYIKSKGGLNCPFCREPTASDDGGERKMMKRVKANDPVALSYVGERRYREGDYHTAFEYWTKAAELEDIRAHYELGCLYEAGEGVEKDAEKKVYHWEKAAIVGHHDARYNLGYVEEGNGNIDRAVRHFIIAANLGDEGSMKVLWAHYSLGNITKEDLESTLRTHKAAIDAMKSAQREAAVAWRKNKEVHNV